MPSTGGEGKPAILCLHGGGSSVAIFKVQTQRLQNDLRRRFDFVFANAPFETAAGPGILPVFEDAGPFYTWVKPGDTAPEETTKLLERAIADQVAVIGRAFVGVMGFSQGARLTVGLLLDQQEQRQSHEMERTQMVDGTRPAFGVLLIGTYPALVLHGSLPESPQRISLPALHAIGRHDPYREDGKTLMAEYFQAWRSKTVEFQVNHRVPILKDEVKELAGQISLLYPLPISA